MLAYNVRLAATALACPQGPQQVLTSCPVATTRCPELWQDKLFFFLFPLSPCHTHYKPLQCPTVSLFLFLKSSLLSPPPNKLLLYHICSMV